MNAIQAQQTQLQAQASAFFSDTSVQTALTAGFQAMSDQHAALTAQLNQLLSVQNQVLAQAQAAAQAAGNLASLADQQSKQLAAITSAVTTQLNQIQAAQQSGAIGTAAAMQLQLAAIIAQLQAEKNATLANVPCNLAGAGYPLPLLANYNDTAARIRLVWAPALSAGPPPRAPAWR